MKVAKEVNIEILNLLKGIGERERRIVDTFKSRNFGFGLHKNYVKDLIYEFRELLKLKEKKDIEDGLDRINGIISMIKGECFYDFKHLLEEHVKERIWLWDKYRLFNDLEDYYNKVYEHLFQNNILEASRVRSWLKEGLKRDLVINFKNLLNEFDSKLKFQKEFLLEENELFEKVIDLRLKTGDKGFNKLISDISKEIVLLDEKLDRFERLLIEERRLLEQFSNFKVFNIEYKIDHLDIYYDLKQLKDPEDIVLYVSDLLEMNEMFDNNIILFLEEISNLRIKELKKEEIRRKVNEELVDGVSGCLSKKLFDFWIKLEAKPGVSLIIIDVDDLDDISRDFGEKSADWVLRETGKAIIDEIGFNKAFRYGRGFVALIDGNEKIAFMLGENIRKAVEDVKFKFKEKIIKTTVSVGVCSYEKNVSKTLNRGAEALYYAKQSGRNKVIRGSMLN